uniref:Protein 4 n=1 Tax=Senecio virus 1 TaxID=2977988 RepID=A0A9N6YJJ9_9RHAB|nr:TPA_asm: protein 4 [Senecio virus 1]
MTESLPLPNENSICCLVQVARSHKGKLTMMYAEIMVALENKIRLLDGRPVGQCFFCLVQNDSRDSILRFHHPSVLFKLLTALESKGLIIPGLCEFIWMIGGDVCSYCVCESLSIECPQRAMFEKKGLLTGWEEADYQDHGITSPKTI